MEINNGIGGVSFIGTNAVSPGQTTTYTLKASGCGGTAQRTVTVTVNTPVAPPGGSSSGILTADLRVTDLYPGSWPQGSIFMRIINDGPGSPSNVNIQLSCTTNTHPNNGNPPSASGSSGSLKINLTPGQGETYPTGITVDGTLNWYDITCSVQVPFSDPNSSNDSYSETFPPKP